MKGDEDCLYLNVYTMDIVKKRPVMIWIHGGAFSMGSGDATFYGPDYIVQKDVVLVTLNYRLGVLGMLHVSSIIRNYATLASRLFRRFLNFKLPFSKRSHFTR